MKTHPTIGTTSYGFRYLLLDERRAPDLVSIVRAVREQGLDTLQICENARPLALSQSEWRDVIRAAGDLGVELHLGCMTLDPETLIRYLNRAGDLAHSNVLRIVIEEETGQRPSGDTIARFLDQAVPQLEQMEMRLAIENHFHIACRKLADVVAAYPRDLVGFCIDTANSLRNFEPVEQVFEYLENRAIFYHLKDFAVHGSNVGFTVAGAPLGEGDLDLSGCLDRVRARDPLAPIFLENWVPPTGDSDVDIAMDAEWLKRSLNNLRSRLNDMSLAAGPGAKTVRP
jgi:sugar phosphate isomerase/epimerase